MKNKKVGLYLGVDSLGGVILDNKKILSMTRLDIVSLEEEVRVEALNEQVKWEALINRALREMGAENKNVSVSLADRDFIFRSFEVPLMRKKEIEASIAYEIEKYIPFKVEELRWDYSYVSFPKEKKVSISFVGMREDVYKNTSDILNRLGLNPIAVEPSSLSLMRVLNSTKKYSKLKNFVLLDLSESEAYLTFFYYGLPVFNRYFIVPKEDGDFNVDKLIEPIHLSFQYFKREFKSYDLDKVVVVSATADQQLQELLKEELQTEVDLVTFYDLVGKEGGSIENLKALGCAGRDVYPYEFKPVLKPAVEKAEEIASSVDVDWRLGMLAGVAALCIAVTAGLFLFTEKKASAQLSIVEQEEAALVVPNQLNGLLASDMVSVVSSKQERVKRIKDIVDYHKKVNTVLEAVPLLMPKGLWLDSLKLSTVNGQYLIQMEGSVFLDDSYRESEVINTFIGDLGVNKEVAKVFTTVEMVSSQRGNNRTFMVTNFNLTLK